MRLREHVQPHLLCSPQGRHHSALQEPSGARARDAMHRVHVQDAEHHVVLARHAVSWRRCIRAAHGGSGSSSVAAAQRERTCMPPVHGDLACIAADVDALSRALYFRDWSSTASAAPSNAASGAVARCELHAGQGLVPPAWTYGVPLRRCAKIAHADERERWRA